MAVQIQHFAPTIPAGTPAASPITAEMQLGVFTVEWVEIDVPTGPAGDMGFYLASSQQQIIPYRTGDIPNWFVFAGVSKHWDLEDQPDSGDWQLVGYNTGMWPHTVYVTFGLGLIDAAAQAPASLVLLPASTLSSAAS